LRAVSVDSGVIIEYMDLDGIFHPQAKAIFESVLAGKMLCVIAHPVLAETYYVAAKVYEKLKVTKPEDRAEALLYWLYRTPNMTVAEPTLELALLAGKIKSIFGVALTDAYVIATSKLHEGTAIFRRRETEMKKKLQQLTRSYQIVFLEDYANATYSLKQRQDRTR